MKQKKQFITVQSVSPELMASVKGFLESHPRIRSLSALATVALETYIELGTRYGIDADWKVCLPERGDSDTNQAG